MSSHKVPWWRIHFGEEEIGKLAESVANEHIGQGPVTAEFEDKFAQALGVPYAVATTSGSTALLLSLMALGIKKDDEVIVPDRTWIATAHSVVMLGAKVVLVDVLGNEPSFDIDQIEGKITPRTKAIIPVHLNGRANNMTEINSLAEKYGLVVVEDACQALFSRNPKGYLGTQSDAGCFSLGVSKLISTGQGGVVVTRNPRTYESLKLFRNHGVVDNFTDTWNQMGFNFKFTDLLASFGLVQLERAPSRIAHVNQVYAKYASAVAEFEYPFLNLIPVNVSAGEVPLYVDAVSGNRQKLMSFLESRGIQSRPFPPSLHTSDYLNNSGEFPNSINFAESGMYLPCGPDQPLGNVDQVLEILYEYGRQLTPTQ